MKNRIPALLATAVILSVPGAIYKLDGLVGEALAQTTVVDQSPVPIPGSGNTTLASEWLLQSEAVTGGTCYQSFFKQPGQAGAGTGVLQVGGLNCIQTANTFSAIQGSVTPFPITGLAAAQGGSINVTGGTSSTSGNAGGASQLVGGTPGATGAGGAAQVTGGAGGTTSGTGGAATVTAGAGTAGNAAGGVASLVGGAGQGTGNGGATDVTGGASGAGATGAGGAVVTAGGAALSTNGAGGAVSMTGGAGAGTGNGGAASVVGGAAGATGTGGAVSITAGSPTAGNGSSVTVTASAGAGSTNGGGSINLVPGAAVSTGAPGTVQVNGNAGLICHSQFSGTTSPSTGQTIFLATRPLLVEQVEAIWSVAAGGTSTLGVFHDTGTTAPGGGTNILTGNFNLNTTANTAAAGTLISTVSSLTMAAGDRISIALVTGTYGSTAGLTVAVCFAPQ
jgi:hypothetical protein